MTQNSTALHGFSALKQTNKYPMTRAVVAWFDGCNAVITYLQFNDMHES